MLGRHRRTILHMALAGLIVLGSGCAGLYFLIVRAVLLREVDTDGARIAAPLVSVMLGPQADRAALEAALLRHPLMPGELVSLHDANGRLLRARGKAVALPDPLPLGGHMLAGTPPRRLVVTPVVSEGQSRGFVVQARSLVDFEHTLWMVVLGLGIMVPLTLVLAFIMTFWFAKQLAKPVEEALIREQQFTRDASHQLRTPLALILTQTQLFLQRPDLDPEVRGKLEQTERSTRRIKSLVHDLLILGRYNAGLGEDPLRFSLCEVLEEEAELVEPVAHAHHVELSLDELPAEVMVLGSPHGIAQVIHNLLSNAVAYAPRGSVVRVGLKLAGSRALLSVHNLGPAIPPEDHERVFERFVRLPHGRDRRPDGTGLGLAIARAIARAHEGDVTLTSNPLDGTTVTISLPLA